MGLHRKLVTALKKEESERSRAVRQGESAWNAAAVLKKMEHTASNPLRGGSIEQVLLLLPSMQHTPSPSPQELHGACPGDLVACRPPSTVPRRYFYSRFSSKLLQNTATRYKPSEKRSWVVALVTGTGVATSPLHKQMRQEGPVESGKPSQARP